MEENKTVEIDGFQYITISGEGESFEKALTNACLDGFEIVKTNSFAVQKPNLVKNTLEVVIIYTAILKIRAKFKAKEGNKND